MLEVSDGIASFGSDDRVTRVTSACKVLQIADNERWQKIRYRLRKTRRDRLEFCDEQLQAGQLVCEVDSGTFGSRAPANAVQRQKRSR